MGPTAPVAGHRSGSGPYTAAQLRVIGAALDLFAEHGVGGTSLQMIADAIGVSKAAVYHQFKTKDEIVLAAAEAELDRVAAAVELAEAEPDGARARELLVDLIVDLAVERRRMESTLLGDPVIIRVFARQERFRQVMDHLYRLLAGDDAGPDARVSAAMLTAAIGGAVMHPLVMDLDDDTLRAQLRRLARRFLDLPDDHR
jgi:AcrR family transcriptional regulator